MGMQLLMKFLNSKAPVPEAPVPVPRDVDGVLQLQPGELNPFQQPPKTANLGWDFGTTIDMHVFVSVSPIGDVFRGNQRPIWLQQEDTDLPRFVWSNITFGNWTEHREEQFDIKLPQSVIRNGTLWAHTFLCANGSQPNPMISGYDTRKVVQYRTELTRHRPKKRIRKVKSLLSGSDEPEPELETQEPGVVRMRVSRLSSH